MVRIVIPGSPKGKSRTKFGNGHAYTPEATTEYEQLAGSLYQAAGGSYFGEEAIVVEIIAGYAVPKRTSKRQQQKMISGTLFPTKKPDADNIAKIILDGLNGIAYKDDKQIVSCMVTKKYMEKPCTIVMVDRMEAKT